jgi:hypothetical protein
MIDMSSDILDSDLAQAGGWTTVVGTVLLNIMEWIGHLTVNDVLQGMLLVGSVIFLYYKILNARLDSKIKKKQLNDDSPKKS